jgi:small subunit ribosomal protein S6
MRSYELGVILHPDLEEADVTSTIETIGQYVQSGGGQVASVDLRGRRALAYPIGKHKNGIYAFFGIQLETSAMKELDRSLKLDEKILRFLLIRPDES